MSITRVTRVDPTPYPMHRVDEMHALLALLTGGR